MGPASLMSKKLTHLCEECHQKFRNVLKLIGFLDS